MAKRYGDEEDVRQTVDMTFFQCIARYQRKDSEKGPIPFSGFLYSYFFYLLKKNVDTFLIDQLGRKSFPLLDDEANSDDDEDGNSPGFKAPAEEVDMDKLLATEDINEFWVLGENCAEPFSLLTVQERQLLKWRYIDGLRSSEISKKITEHPNTVREHLSKIRSKIKDIVINSNLEDVLYIFNKKEGKHEPADNAEA
jgi:DNA-directed RNA polymerase specialized sigma24 family protein